LLTSRCSQTGAAASLAPAAERQTRQAGTFRLMVNQVEFAEGCSPSVISIGDLSKSELLTTLSDNDIHLNQAAKDLFSDHRFQPRLQAVAVRIVALSISDLGFQGGASYCQIVARALELGFFECPLELAPYMRLQFMNQPEASDDPSSTERGAPPGAFTIASRPLDETDQVPKGFYLRHTNGEFWLRGYWSDSSHIWSQEDVFVFSLDKQQPNQPLRTDRAAHGC